MIEPPLIQLLDVGRVYPGPPPVTALRSVTLRIARGDYVAVTGPSGSGKSTLLHVLGLLDTPTSGRYVLDSVDAGGLAEKDLAAIRGRQIGFVFQSFYLLPFRTAQENVALAQLYTGVPRSRRLARAREALDAVGLAHRGEVLPSMLSGGERQRVAVARALANDPSLLLFDEPTGNLDSTNTGIVLDLVERLHARGYTIVVITHDASVAARAGRVITIRDGEVERDTGAGPARPVQERRTPS